jgi:ferric-dicitrate binding protein FerR (iron transport regulator)
MEELFLLIGQGQDEQLLPLLQAEWVKARDRGPATDINWEQLYGAMVVQSRNLEITPSLESTKSSLNIPSLERVPSIRRRRIRRSWFIAAVFFLLLISGGAILRWSHITSTPAPLVIPVVSRFKNDVQPGGNKAILTLSDGSSIVLDSAGNGKLSVQGNATVVKLANGRLAYHASGDASMANTPVFNTISTPKGGQYQVVLPDGSKVWLDATSSIRFPTAFDEKQRKVELIGEAYFEVTANPLKPFIVTVLSQQKEKAGELQKILVLGTRFNVMAYGDENTVKTTLLDGEVEVAGTTGGKKLRPGEQAQLIRGDQANINVVSDVDVDAAVAWKNGYFDFNRADIHTIMRQLSRWYDVEVVYQGNGVGKEFYGGMQRDLPLSAVFRILEKSGVEFSIDGKKVMVNL